MKFKQPDPVMDRALLRWENEGGSPSANKTLLGSPSQIEWAESIRARVGDEFDRVETLFRSVASRQDVRKRSATEAILAILDDKRVDVLNRNQAGYFIRNWQEIGAQVRNMILQDPRYKAIKARE